MSPDFYFITRQLQLFWLTKIGQGSWGINNLILNIFKTRTKIKFIHKNESYKLRGIFQFEIVIM